MKSTLIATILGTMLIAGGSFAKTAPVSAGDEAITRQAVHEVRMYPYYSIWDDVRVEVANGAVRLSGDVSQPVKKSDLGRIMSRVPGVTAVDNELNVEPLSPFDNQLRVQVARAVLRNPMLSQYAIQPVPPIHIIVNNGHVRLEGVVRTQNEKDMAGLAASSSMSFGQVINNLRVEQPSKKG